MAVSGVVSVASGVNTSLVFTVTGTSTLGYAEKYANAVNTASANSLLTFASLDGSTAATAPGNSGQVIEYTIGKSESVTIPTAGAYTLDSVGGAVTITGAAQDSVLVAAINAQATYNAVGSDNQVTFVTGTNLYNGSSSGQGDTVVTGSGFDTVRTGTGATTVDSGTGQAAIYLNDTTAAATGVYNDYVYLDDGKSTVYANGQSDAIVATASGQTVFGGSSSGPASTLMVSLLPNNDGTSSGNDIIQGGAGHTYVFDGSNNNSVFGGSGELSFVGAAGVTASVVSGTGATSIFGSAGDSIGYANAAGDSQSTLFVAGIGNETLNGAAGTNSLTMYGYQDTASGQQSGVVESITGGSGNDLLVSGSGAETLVGGAGQNTFFITDQTTVGSGASITLADWNTNSSNFVEFGQPQQAVDMAVQNGQSDATGFTITLSDHTTVKFIGIHSASELSGHITGT